MMLTREAAAATWCPMVRVARHEVTRIETPLTGGFASVSEDHHVVGGCNSASGIGRGTRNPASARCIADQCAMWRWGEAAAQPRRPQTWRPAPSLSAAEPARGPGVPPDATWDGEFRVWVEAQAVIDGECAAADARRRGYCGLAGAPVIAGGAA